MDFVEMEKEMEWKWTKKMEMEKMQCNILHKIQSNIEQYRKT